MESKLPYKLTSPGRLVIQDGGGFTILLGVAVFFAGLLLLRYSLHLILIGYWIGLGFFPLALMILTGVTLILKSGEMMFVCRKVIDLPSGTVTQSKGFFYLIKSQCSQLADYGGVSLQHAENGQGRADSFSVLLLAVGTAGDLIIYDPRKFAESYPFAVYLAEFLNMPLQDASTGHIQIM